MATTKKTDDIQIEDMTIITQKTIIDPGMITFNKNHSFTLQPGNYKIELHVEAGRLGTRTQIRDLTDNAIMAMSTTGIMRDDFTAIDKHEYIIEYLAERQWQPIQTLDPNNVTATLTLL